jgi:hypothetical protein
MGRKRNPPRAETAKLGSCAPDKARKTGHLHTRGCLGLLAIFCLFVCAKKEETKGRASGRKSAYLQRGPPVRSPTLSFLPSPFSPPFFSLLFPPGVVGEESMHQMDAYEEQRPQVHMVDEDGDIDTTFQNEEEFMNLMTAYLEYVFYLHIFYYMAFFCIFNLVFFQ